MREFKQPRLSIVESRGPTGRIIAGSILTSTFESQGPDSQEASPPSSHPNELRYSRASRSWRCAASRHQSRRHPRRFTWLDGPLTRAPVRRQPPWTRPWGPTSSTGSLATPLSMKAAAPPAASGCRGLKTAGPSLWTMPQVRTSIRTQDAGLL